MVATGPRSATGRCGLSETDPAELGEAVVLAWDDFLAVVRSPTTDLDRPSRLKGLSGRDVLVHLGEWPDHATVDSVLVSAAEGGHGTSQPPGDTSAELVAAHDEATTEQVIEAVVAARDRVQRFFDGPEAATWGRSLARSTVGPLPVLSLLHAGTFELAVHALDLAPCGAPPPSAPLLDRGLAALIDITGSLAAGAGVDLALTGATPAGGWRFTTGPAVGADGGWTTTQVGPAPFEGVGVSGPAADLLDAAAGRTHLPQLLLGRRIHVQELAQWLRLAPLLEDTPGLPGGAALASAAAGLSGVAGGLSSLTGAAGRALGRFRR
jgi:hypothetical protein